MPRPKAKPQTGPETSIHGTLERSLEVVTLDSRVACTDKGLGKYECPIHVVCGSKGVGMVAGRSHRGAFSPPCSGHLIEIQVSDFRIHDGLDIRGGRESDEFIWKGFRSRHGLRPFSWPMDDRPIPRSSDCYPVHFSILSSPEVATMNTTHPAPCDWVA